MRAEGWDRQRPVRVWCGSYSLGPRFSSIIGRMSTLERAIVIAAEGHAGQLDKAGNPYILHPLRVMLRLDTNEERIAGVLHDVVEDCGWTSDDLRDKGVSSAVLRSVESV